MLFHSSASRGCCVVVGEKRGQFLTVYTSLSYYVFNICYPSFVSLSCLWSVGLHRLSLEKAEDERALLFWLLALPDLEEGRIDDERWLLGSEP